MKNRFFAAVLLIALVSFPLGQAFAQESGVQTIPIGTSALDVKVSGDKVYVTNPEEGVISVLDANSRQVIQTIPAPKGVLFIEIVEEKNKIYATVEGINKVIVFDLQTYEQLKEIDLGEEEIVRFSKADKPYGEREYVYFATSGVGLKYNPINDLLYVVHSEVNHVNVIDTDSDESLGDISVGITPVQIAIDETANVAYVTNWESNNLSIIDLNTNQVTGTLHTGFVPTRMLIDQQNRMMYVSHHASPHVTVVDLTTGTIEKNIQLKGPTHALALDEKAGLLHVTYKPESGFTGQAFLHRVEFIDTKTNTLVSGIDIPANPYTMTINDDEQLFASVIREGVVFSVDLPATSSYQNIVAQSQEGQTEGGGCLIATAAFGSELAPQVQLLREVRDNVLLGTASGTEFMNTFNSAYYLFSPAVADLERDMPVFKEIVKITITPMLSTLSILSYVDVDSEQEMLGYGIGIIMLNLGIYFVIPAVIILKIRDRLKKPE